MTTAAINLIADDEQFALEAGRLTFARLDRDEAEAEVQRAVAAMKARVHAEDMRIASFIEANPEESVREARAFVTRFLGSERHARYHWILRRWDKLLQTKSASEIAEIFRVGSEATEELRSSAPFCGPSLEAF